MELMASSSACVWIFGEPLLWHLNALSQFSLKRVESWHFWEIVEDLILSGDEFYFKYMTLEYISIALAIDAWQCAEYPRSHFLSRLFTIDQSTTDSYNHEADPIPTLSQAHTAERHYSPSPVPQLQDPSDLSGPHDPVDQDQSHSANQ